MKRHLTLRIREETLAEIDRLAGELSWTRTATVNALLRIGLQTLARKEDMRLSERLMAGSVRDKETKT